MDSYQPDFFQATALDPWWDLSRNPSGWENPGVLREWLTELTVSQGPKAGERLELLDWEEAWLAEEFKNPLSGVSIPKGFGKSTFAAALAVAAIDGPLRLPRGEVLVAASSANQADLVFSHAVSFRPEWESPKQYRLSRSPGNMSLRSLRDGSRLHILSSDPKRSHGYAPHLVICDEPAQWPNAGFELWESLRNGLGKHPYGHMIGISTMPADSTHFFAEIIKAGTVPGVQLSILRTLTDPEKWDDESQWLKDFPELEPLGLLPKYREELKAAKTFPALIPSFKALRLNMGTNIAGRMPLVEVEDWEAVLSKQTPEPLPAGEGIVWGIDLGGSSALSCVSAVSSYWDIDAIAQVPVGDAGDLASKDKADGADGAYLKAEAEGNLFTVPSRMPRVVELLQTALDRWGMPVAISCDRWRQAELQDALQELNIRRPVVVRGQGWKDGSEDVRNWQHALEHFRPVAPATLLTASISEAVVVSDPAGNVKLAKGSEGGRRIRHKDDVVAAAILAASLQRRRLAHDMKPRGRVVHVA